MRSAYDWMMRFAEKPNAERALFGISFAEASFFPIPPDPLLMAMGAAKPNRAIRFAAITTAASVLGAMLGWCIGMFLWEAIGERVVHFYDPEEHTLGKIRGWFDEYGRENQDVVEYVVKGWEELLGNDGGASEEESGSDGGSGMSE